VEGPNFENALQFFEFRMTKNKNVTC